MKEKHATRTNIMNIISAYSGQQNIVAIPRVYVEMTGDYNRAALLNQILYWSERTSDKNGWFYKSAAEWQAELGLSAYQVKRAVEGDKRAKDNSKALINLGIETTIKKSPKGAPTTHYRVNEAVFVACLTETLDSMLNFNNVENGKSTLYEMESKQCQQSSYTETTTETTVYAPDTAKDEKKQRGESKPNTQNFTDLPLPEPLPDDASPIEQLERAYREAVQAIELTLNPKDIERLRKLHEADITPDVLTAFVTEKQAEDWWQGKRVSIKHIAENIGAWQAARNTTRFVPRSEQDPGEFLNRLKVAS